MSEYEVKGEIDNPIALQEKERKLAKLRAAEQAKEEEKKRQIEQAAAEKAARVEEKRREKEKALAAKIRRDTSELEIKMQEEAAQKSAEKERREAEEARLAEEEARRAAEAEKEAAAQAAAARQAAEKAEREAREAKQRAKRDAEERRLQMLREEEALADRRRDEINKARTLEVRVAEAKRQGKLPDTFIPMIWTSDDRYREEILAILERPYWEEKPVEPAKPASTFVSSAPESQQAQDLYRNDFVNHDEWLKSKQEQFRMTDDEKARLNAERNKRE